MYEPQPTASLSIIAIYLDDYLRLDERNTFFFSHPFSFLSEIIVKQERERGEEKLCWLIGNFWAVNDRYIYVYGHTAHSTLMCAPWWLSRTHTLPFLQATSFSIIIPIHWQRDREKGMKVSIALRERPSLMIESCSLLPVPLVTLRVSFFFLFLISSYIFFSCAATPPCPIRPFLFI